MMHPSAAYIILQKNIPSYMLQGYVQDLINEEAGRLYAFTFVDIDPETFENNYADWGYSSMGFDEEKTRIYLDEGKCFQHKNSTQCAQEGIYKAFSLKFYGCFYEERWYIQKELTYFGEHINREDAIITLSESIKDGSVLNSTYYLPMQAHFPQWNPAEQPLSRGVEQLEFTGMPELVAYIKQQEKQALLQAHSRFLYLDVFSPLLNRLKASRFNEYNEYAAMYLIEYSFIFSAARNFALLPLMIMNSKKEYRICYFFWHGAERKVYQWHYFKSHVYHSSFHYAEEIINDLSGVCYWNNVHFLHSSCTLDDENFWQNYVLVKQNGQYLYLTEPG